MKRWILSCVLGNKIQEIPLRHEGEKFAMCRQVGKIRNFDRFTADVPRKLTDFLMWTFQKVLENAELIHELESRGMDRVSAEIAQEVGMLLEHHDVDPTPGEQEAQHDAGRPASCYAAPRVQCFSHSWTLNIIGG